MKSFNFFLYILLCVNCLREQQEKKSAKDESTTIHKRYIAKKNDAGENNNKFPIVERKDPSIKQVHTKRNNLDLLKRDNHHLDEDININLNVKKDKSEKNKVKKTTFEAPKTNNKKDIDLPVIKTFDFPKLKDKKLGKREISHFQELLRHSDKKQEILKNALSDKADIIQKQYKKIENYGKKLKKYQIILEKENTENEFLKKQIEEYKQKLSVAVIENQKTNVSLQKEKDRLLDLIKYQKRKIIALDKQIADSKTYESNFLKNLTPTSNRTIYYKQPENTVKKDKSLKKLKHEKTVLQNEIDSYKQLLNSLIKEKNNIELINKEFSKREQDTESVLENYFKKIENQRIKIGELLKTTNSKQQIIEDLKTKLYGLQSKNEILMKLNYELKNRNKNKKTKDYTDNFVTEDAQQKLQIQKLLALKQKNEKYILELQKNMKSLTAKNKLLVNKKNKEIDTVNNQLTALTREKETLRENLHLEKDKCKKKDYHIQTLKFRINEMSNELRDLQERYLLKNYSNNSNQIIDNYKKNIKNLKKQVMELQKQNIEKNKKLDYRSILYLELKEKYKKLLIGNTNSEEHLKNYQELFNEKADLEKQLILMEGNYKKAIEYSNFLYKEKTKVELKKNKIEKTLFNLKTNMYLTLNENEVYKEEIEKLQHTLTEEKQKGIALKEMIIKFKNEIKFMKELFNYKKL